MKKLRYLFIFTFCSWLSIGYTYSMDLDYELIKAVNELDLQKVKKLLNLGANPNATDDTGKPALTLAVRSLGIDITELLIKYGADVNYVGTRGNISDKDWHFYNKPTPWDSNLSTPLHEAAYESSPMRINLLIQNGANVNAQNSDGETPLMIAALLADKDCIQLLLKANALVNIQDRNCRSAIFKVMESSFNKGHAGARLECIKLLIDAGINVNAQDNKGTTPLIDAIRSYTLNPDIFDKIIDLLLKANAQAIIPDKDGNTAFVYATKNNIEKVISQFIAIGAFSQEVLNEIKHIEKPTLKDALIKRIGDLQLAIALLARHLKHNGHAKETLVLTASYIKDKMYRTLFERHIERAYSKPGPGVKKSCIIS